MLRERILVFEEVTVNFVGIEQGRRAAGMDAIFIDTHLYPTCALCDAASQLSVYDLEEFLKPLIELQSIEVKHRHI